MRERDFRDRIPRVRQVREACLRGPISTLLVGIGVEGFGDSPLFLFSIESDVAPIDICYDRLLRPDPLEDQPIYEVRLHPSAFVV